MNHSRTSVTVTLIKHTTDAYEAVFVDFLLSYNIIPEFGCSAYELYS